MSKSACKARNNFLQRKYAFNSIVGNCTACTGTNFSHKIYINQWKWIGQLK